MSDNEDLLGDIGDQSLADYNLGHDEEEKLLADDFEHNENGSSRPFNNFPNEYPVNPVPYRNQPEIYTIREDRVVPNLTVEVPRPLYAPYEPPKYVPREETAIVPGNTMGLPVETPHIVPPESLGDRRTPRVRDIPDTLDKVVVPGNFGQRGSRTSWRNPHYTPYRRNNVQRGNFQQRPAFPPPNQIVRPQIRPEPQPHIPSPQPHIPSPQPHIPSPQMPDNPQANVAPLPRPPMLSENDEKRVVSLQQPPYVPFQQNFRPNLDHPRPNMRPHFPYQRPMRPFAPIPEPLIPQVTIRQNIPPHFPHKMNEFLPKMGMNPVNPEFIPVEQEVRMLPIHLSQNLPPGGLQGKKVLINPHFKGNFQPPIEGMATYIPTRIQKSPIPPIQPTVDIPLGPPKDLDDAAERFIAEQRSALARANNRKFQRRSPQRYIENTTIEIENEQYSEGAHSDADLLRRQEEFINANRAGLRRRMRSRSRSPSPSPSPVGRHRSVSPRRARPDNPHDEDNEYRRKMREQEQMRERVTKAKEQRRRKHAAFLDREKERERIQQEREKEKEKEREREKEKEREREKEKEKEKEKEREREKSKEKEKSPPKVVPREPTPEPSPPKAKTPPRAPPKSSKLPPKKPAEVTASSVPLKQKSPARSLTPPLPEKKKEDKVDYDFDDLELILNDFEGILSDDEDSGRFKEIPKKAEAPKTKPQPDLRTKLVQKPAVTKPPKMRQKIVFNEDSEETKYEKTPPKKKSAVTSPKIDSDNSDKNDNDAENIFNPKRQRITFNTVKPQLPQKTEEKSKSGVSFNRRVVLQRKIPDKKGTKIEPIKPSSGLFSRAIRNTLPPKEPQILYDSSDDESVGRSADRSTGRSANVTADVTNLPHGITDTRLRTLAGPELQVFWQPLYIFTFVSDVFPLFNRAFFVNKCFSFEYG